MRRIASFETCACTLVLLLAITIPATAADCIDYQNYLHLLAVEQEASSLFALAVDPPYVYGSHGSRLATISLHDPGAPLLVSALQMPIYYARTIVRHDRTLFLACPSIGLGIVDVAIPTAPIWIGAYTGSGTVWDLAVQHPLVFLAANGGLVILDVSDPATPLMVGQHAMSISAVAVAQAGGLAYASVNEGPDDCRVTVVDCSDPTTPTPVASLALPVGEAHPLAFGPVVYVGGADGIVVLDVEDPRDPQVVTILPTTGPARPMVHDGLLLCADNDLGMRVYDLGDPFAPTLLATYTTAEDTYDIAAVDDLALVACDDDDGGLYVLDITHRLAPPMLQTITLNENATEVEVGTGCVVVAREQPILDIYAAASGGTIAPLSTLSLLEEGGQILDLAVAGELAAVLVEDIHHLDHLRLVDLADPAHPVARGAYQPQGTSVVAVAVAAGRALLSEYDVYGKCGLSLIDVSDLDTPRIVGSMSTPGACFHAVIAETLAYVGCGQDLLTVAVGSPTAPAPPHVVASVLLPSFINGLAVSGGLGAAGCREHGLQLFTFDSEGLPVLRGTAGAMAIGARTVALAPGVAYAKTTPAAGFAVWDVSNPDDPQLLGGSSSPGFVYDLELFAGRPIASGGRSLTVAPAACADLTAVTDEPRSPAPASTSTILGVAPNPGNPCSEVRFVLAATEAIDLTLHDLAGRRIVTLEHRWLPAGVHVRRWDGRDDHGRPVASGTYMVRLEAASGQSVSRLTIVR